MGDLLRDMMNERAGAQAAPEIDLDAIVRAGDRRVWRRRAVAGVGTAAAVAAVAFSAPAVIDGVRDDSIPPVATQPTGQTPGGFETRTTTYAIGTSIYYGAQAIDVSPHRVQSFVQTDHGFVVADEDGTVLLADGETVTDIGQAAQGGFATLAADDVGGLVTWVDDSAAVAEFVVYDTATGEEVAREADPGASTAEGRPPEFGVALVEAMDSGVAYWHRSDGTVAFDVETGETDMLREGTSFQWLKDVEDGVIASSTFDDQGVVVSEGPAPESQVVSGYTLDADLSPGGTWLVTYPRTGARIFDLRAPQSVPDGGIELAVETGGSPGRVVQWLNDERFVAFVRPAGSESGPVDLVECTAPIGDCETTAASAGPLRTTVFPDGRPVSY